MQGSARTMLKRQLGREGEGAGQKMGEQLASVSNWQAETASAGEFARFASLCSR